MNRQEQLKELRCTLKKIWGSMFLGVLPLVSLWAGAKAVDKLNVITGNSSSPWLAFGLGALCLVVLTFYYPMKRVKLEGRLENALNLLEELTVQEEIDHRLRHYARLTADANRLQVEAQNELSLARTEDEEEMLRVREQDAKTFFESYSKRFYNLCRWAESSGYKVLKTSKGKPSFKLYLPKREAQPSASTSRKDQEHLGDPEPPI